MIFISRRRFLVLPSGAVLSIQLKATTALLPKLTRWKTIISVQPGHTTA